MSSEALLNWQSFGWTDVGPKRQRNEDALLERGDSLLWVVADGMGGHEAGQIASQTVIDNINGCALTEHLGQSSNRLRDALRDANQTLREYAREHGAQIVGSTVVALIARGNYCCLLWAGDSRIYRIRNGKIKQLTTDHSHVTELLLRGHITEEQAESHPHANMITRAVGAADELRVDGLTMEVLPDDRYLLCSDGLSGVLRPEVIVDTLQSNHPNPAELLVETAIEANTTDNVTAIVIDTRGA